MEGHGEGTHSGSAHGEVLSFIAKQVLAFKPCALLLLGEFGANDFSCRIRNALAARGGRSVMTLTNRHMLKMCSRHSVYNAATKLARCLLGATALVVVDVLPRQSAIAKRKFFWSL